LRRSARGPALPARGRRLTRKEDGLRRPLSNARLVGLVSAGLGGAGLVRGLEGLTATAARNGVRVAKREPAAHERVHEVDLRALDVHRAHRVDDDAYTVLLDQRVVLLAAFREGHSVREARASTRR